MRIYGKVTMPLILILVKEVSGTCSEHSLLYVDMNIETITTARLAMLPR